MVRTHDRRRGSRSNASDLLSSNPTNSTAPKPTVGQDPRDVDLPSTSNSRRKAVHRSLREADLPRPSPPNASLNGQREVRHIVSRRPEEQVATTPTESDVLANQEPSQQPSVTVPLDSTLGASSITNDTGSNNQNDCLNQFRLYQPSPQMTKPRKRSRMIQELESHNDDPEKRGPATPMFGLDSPNGGLHLTRGAKKDLAKLAANLTPSPKKNQNLRKLILDQFNPRRSRKVFVNDGSSLGTTAGADSDDGCDEIAWSVVSVQGRSTNNEGPAVNPTNNRLISSEGEDEDEGDSTASLADTSPDIWTPSNESIDGPRVKHYFEPYSETQFAHGRKPRSETTDSGFAKATFSLKAQQDWTAQKKQIKKLVLRHGYKLDASVAEVNHAIAAREASKDPDAYYSSKLETIPEGYNGSFFHMEGGLFVFKPTAARFTDFGNFMKEVEELAGRERGVVKVVVPQECMGRISSLQAEDRFLQTCMVKSSIQEPKVNGIAALYNIHTSLANRSIPASLWLDKIQKSRLSHIEEWKIDQDNVPESLKTLQIWEYYTEQEMFKDNEWISEDRLYAKGIEGKPQLRASLGCRDPSMKNLMGNRFAMSSTTQYGINEPVFNVSGKPGTMFCMQIGRYAGYSMEILHRGAPKCWTVVKPSHHNRLEDRVRKLLYSSKMRDDPLAPGVPLCSQFVRHRPVYVPQETLTKHKIDYTKIVQHQGEMIIIFPWAYHQGYDTGPSISEAMMYASDRWKVFNRQNCYQDCNSHCGETSVNHFDLGPVVNSLSPVGSRYGRRLDQIESPTSRIGLKPRESSAAGEEIFSQPRISQRYAVGKSKNRHQDTDSEWVQSDDDTSDSERIKRRGDQATSSREKISALGRNSGLHETNDEASPFNAKATRPDKRERSISNSQAASEDCHTLGSQSKKRRLISPRMRNTQTDFASTMRNSEPERSLYDIENMDWTPHGKR